MCGPKLRQLCSRRARGLCCSPAGQAEQELVLGTEPHRWLQSLKWANVFRAGSYSLRAKSCRQAHHDAASGLQAQGEGRHVQQQQVLHLLAALA